jgi:hypothetical protein
MLLATHHLLAASLAAEQRMPVIALRRYYFWCRLGHIFLPEDVLLLVGSVVVLPDVDTPLD